MRLARALGRDHVVVHFVLARHGGIAPPARRRSRRVLTLAEREDISRGIAPSGRGARSPVELRRDGHLFRLVSEAHRIRLAHLFDPVLAVHTSLVEPLLSRGCSLRSCVDLRINPHGTAYIIFTIN
jgi:hypothetical protein